MCTVQHLIVSKKPRMNQEFNPRLLWNCAEPYLSQTLRDIKGPGGVVFWVCCDISGWLSGGVVRGVVATF